VPIIRIARVAPCADDKRFFGRGRNTRFYTKLIALMGLTLGDAIHMGFMQAVEFVFTLFGLLQQTLSLF
jgi:hypothetical protein